MGELSIKDFQKRLSIGSLDINAPYSPDTDQPFPTGLQLGIDGYTWLRAGKEKNDGEKKDDVIKVSNKKLTVSSLHPIQKQIYVDKSVEPIAKTGAKSSKKFLSGKGTTYVTSKDGFIIDGHHRFLASILLDPKMKVNCMVIDLPINKLLPASLSYSDAIGNKRNA